MLKAVGGGGTSIAALSSGLHALYASEYAARALKSLARRLRSGFESLFAAG
jgi:hypothetical protein